MSAGQWISDNLSLGGLIKHSGSMVGTVAQVGLHGIGAVAEVAAEATGNRNAKAIGDVIRGTGDVANIAITTTGEAAGFVVNKATEYAGIAGGEIAALGAEVVGADRTTIATAKQLGTVIGSAALGTVAGMGVAQTAVALAAAAGTTGAAATASGLAALGGGSLAAGGGGIAAGQAVTQGFVVISSAASAVHQPTYYPSATQNTNSTEDVTLL